MDNNPIKHTHNFERFLGRDITNHQQVESKFRNMESKLEQLQL